VVHPGYQIQTLEPIALALAHVALERFVISDDVDRGDVVVRTAMPENQLATLSGEG